MAVLFAGGVAMDALDGAVAHECGVTPRALAGQGRLSVACLVVREA